MADPGGKSVIVKRVKKGRHKHHGGAWKVAYADFVTAMMAFFLMMWLLNAVTEDQLKGISDYFSPKDAARTPAGADGVLEGRSIMDGPAFAPGAPPGLDLDLPPRTIGPGGEDLTRTEEMSDQERERQRRRFEAEQFRAAEEALRQAIQSIPQLQPLARSLLVDDTIEGLRIQIVDQDGLSMFPRGSSDMFQHARVLHDLIAKVVHQMPQRIAITGHTDSTPFADPTGYSNWELSADRALASRRALIESGVPESRIARVVGKADTDPLISDTPEDPRNRRISIVLMRDAPDHP